MPSWWGKSSSKEAKKKENKGSIINTIQRKLKSASEDKCKDKSGVSRRHQPVSNKESKSFGLSRSTSPSTNVSRCQSFAERPDAQPLPLPALHLSTISCTNSTVSAASKPENARGSQPSLYFPLPKPGHASNQGEPTDAEGDIVTASGSSADSVESDDPSDSCHLSPLASVCENVNITALNNGFRYVCFSLNMSFFFPDVLSFAFSFCFDIFHNNLFLCHKVWCTRINHFLLPQRSQEPCLSQFLNRASISLCLHHLKGGHNI